MLHPLSCSQRHLLLPQHILPNPSLSLVPEGWQDTRSCCAGDAPATTRSKE